MISAGHQDDDVAREALAQLCRNYRYPIYVFIRRLGNSPEDSKDLTQEFFSRFLEKRHVTYANPTKGRFRSFLLTSVKRFLADQAERPYTEKRGGRTAVLAMDLYDAEKRYGSAFADYATPDKLFERAWATTLMDRVTEDIRTEFVREGRAPQFEQLRQFLPGHESAMPYSELAEQAGTTEGALKVAVHRLRRRYRDLFRAEIAHLVAEPHQIDEELQHVLGALRA